MPKQAGNAKVMIHRINRCLSLDRDQIKGFIPEHIRGLIRISNVCGGKDERDGDLFYDVIFPYPVTTRNF